MINPKATLSPFGEAALKLDADFTEVERLASQVEQVDVHSDIGLERAIKLLKHFSECGQRIAEGIQVMAKSLEEARARTEAAANLVAARATEVQKRKEEEDQGLEGFR